MTTDGWEQRLADLGQARELREEIAQGYAKWTAAPYPPAQWQIDNGRDLADALLSGPLAPLLAAQAAVESVEALHVPSKALFMTDRCDLDDELWPCRTIAALRRALDGPT